MSLDESEMKFESEKEGFESQQWLNPQSYGAYHRAHG